MIKIICQSSHLKVSFQEASVDEKKSTEAILKTKFCAKDKKMSHNPLVRKGILSDIRSFYDEEHGILPVGFLPFFEEYLEQENIEYTILESRKFPTPNKEFLSDLLKNKIVYTTHLGPESPRDYQIESVYDVVKNKGGIIMSPTGSGKSLILANLLNVYNKSKCLVLLDTLDLIEQTYNKLTKDYGFKRNEIGVINGDCCDDTKRITLISVFSYEKAFSLFPYINVILADEVHSTGRIDTSEKIIYSCQNASLRIGLSATPWNDNPYETMRLLGNFGPVVFKRETIEHIEDGHLSETHVEIYQYKSDYIKPIGSYSDIYDTKKISEKNPKDKLLKEGYELFNKNGKEYARKFLEYGDEYTHFVNNQARNEKIIEVINKYVKLKKRILVIFNRIDHGKILNEMYPEGTLISGKDDLKIRKVAENLLRDNESTVVFASNIWNKGKDIEQIEVFINASGGVSSVRLIQKVGRVVRKSRTTNKNIAIAVDFDDTHLSGIGRNQTKKRFNVYQNILKMPIKFY